MKTLLQLSKDIQKNPDQRSDLLNSFRTTSKEVRDFLISLNSAPVYLVPALIETFALRHRENDPSTIGDLMKTRDYIGSIFVLVEDESDWNYVGISASGNPLCRPFNSDVVMEMDASKAIRYVF